jgi:hypothetical protein
MEGDGQLLVFTEKLTSATVEPLRNGARQTLREIEFQFDIGVGQRTKVNCKFKNGENLYMKK